jgi:hypothetical protein
LGFSDGLSIQKIFNIQMILSGRQLGNNSTVGVSKAMGEAISTDSFDLRVII